MANPLRVVRAMAVAVAACGVLGGGSAAAQGPGLGSTLGGYGAMAGGPGPSMGGSVVIPGGRGLGTGVALGMSGGGLALRRGATASMGPTRRPFVLDSMEAMSQTAPGMGSRRPFALSPSGVAGGMGLRGGMRPMPAARGMSVMPPSIGYPFRQPPSLVPQTSLGAGMSM